MTAQSSLMTESWALRDGLQLAMEENITKLDVEVDALALTQMLAQQRLDYHPTSNVIYDCRLLMEKFEKISIKNVHREANKCVDALTKDAPTFVGVFYVLSFYF